jgi:hypothetical protein
MRSDLPVIRGQARLSPYLPAFIYVAAFLATLWAAHNVVTDQDPFWHIAVGRWILEHGAVPHRDLFSHSMPGAPWVAHEWLSEAFIALIFDHFGWAGLVVLVAAVFAAALTLLAVYLQRDLAAVPTLAATFGAWGLCLGHLHARPHVFGLPLLVIWFATLDRARAERRAPPWPMAALMALWANLHGGFVLGLALAALLAAEAIFEAPDGVRLRTAARWGAFGALSLLAALATPNGFAGLTLPFSLARMDFALSTIGEWKSPNFQHLQPLELWLLLGLVGAMTFGLKFPLTRTAIVLALLHLALSHLRFAEALGLLAPLVLAPALAAQLPAWRSEPAGAAAKTRHLTSLAAAAVIAVAATAFVRIGVTNESNRFAPTAAVDFVRRQSIAGPVFNDYKFGGYLIYSGFRPFVDGRADMYGDAFLKRSFTVSELPSILAQYGVAWTLLEPEDPRAALLDRLPGWRRAYADEIAVVHLRDVDGR